MSSNPFDSGNSAPSVSFATKDEYGNLKSVPVGTKYRMKVVELPSEVQARNFDTKKPESWPDGNPKMTVVIGVEVNGEKKSFWAPKPSATFTAIKEALADGNGNIRPIEIGGYLTVELVGFGKAEGGKAPQKLYKAIWEAPNAFGAPEVPAASEPAAEASNAADYEKARRIAALSDEDRKLLGL